MTPSDEHTNDLLEYTGDEEDPFTLERYQDAWRDAASLQHLQNSSAQGCSHPTAPTTPPPPPLPPTAPSFSSRLTPQMGINALKMIPEAKIFKNVDTKRNEDSCGKSQGPKLEGLGSLSPKVNLLDLHISRKHKRTASGGLAVTDIQSAKSVESPNLSPRQSREGSQSPKGIRLDLHLSRKHKRTPSSSHGGGFDVHHNKQFDSPNHSSRPTSARTDAESQSPRGYFLDMHIGRKHRRSSSSGQPSSEYAPKQMETSNISSETSPRDHSPLSEKKLIGFLKSHNPFAALQSLSPGQSHRPRNHHSATTDDECSPDQSHPSSPTYSADVNYHCHAKHSSETGRRLSSLQHQSAPSTPSKTLYRYSTDLTGRPVRPRSIVVDGEMTEEGYWNI
ncbi:hypothetical protein SK128_005612 [Halocaridina rubra]|uniref:Uncharacterized protein n=1 Tax=Halocaridina rubra TaxID=373956 RepID=A0AAN9AFG8_HALRR